MNKLTKELIGLELDWAVAKCEGLSVQLSIELGISKLLKSNVEYYSPSTLWSQAGVIIDTNGISIIRCRDDYDYCNNIPIPEWAATTGQHDFYQGYEDNEPSLAQFERDLVFGNTPLIAAMRAYVISKLGNNVDIPDNIIDHRY